MNWMLRTLVLGLGFFGISMVAPLYDSYMPVFYGHYIDQKWLVGIIMGIDNFLMFTLQPYFGALSDQTRTRLGRRIPYLLAGFSSTAVCLVLLPFAEEMGLWLLLGVTILLNLSLASYRSPTVALMPDMIVSEQRSQANGIINFMGGLGYTLTLLLGGMLAQGFGVAVPFVGVAIVLTVVLLAFLLFIREPKDAAGQVEERPKGMLDALVRLVNIRDGRVWTLLGAICFWTLSYQAGLTWFTTFGLEVLHLPVESSMQITAAFSGTYLVLAVPMGFLSGAIGRRYAMAAGAVLMALAMGSLAVLSGQVHLLAALAAAGLGWALIIVNALPAMVELAPEGQTGTYTGIYYIGGGLAGWLSPFLFGLVVDHLGWAALWLGAGLLLLVSAWLVSRARGIEPRGRGHVAAA